MPAMKNTFAGWRVGDQKLGSSLTNRDGEVFTFKCHEGKEFKALYAHINGIKGRALRRLKLTPMFNRSKIKA